MEDIKEKDVMKKLSEIEQIVNIEYKRGAMPEIKHEAIIQCSKAISKNLEEFYNYLPKNLKHYIKKLIELDESRTDIFYAKLIIDFRNKFEDGIEYNGKDIKFLLENLVRRII